MEWLEILKNFYNERPFTYKYLDNEFKVFVSVFLSTRTRDTITEMVCDRLFERVGSFKDLTKIPLEELENIIKPVGFHRVKARNLKRISEILVKEYGSKLPRYEDLLRLPGVGEKVASVIYNVLGKDPRIAVDTHVHRISNRMGIVDTKDPKETMKALERTIPKDRWKDLNSVLVIHGQRICRPLNPLCERCPVKNHCKKYKNTMFFNKVLEKYKFIETKDINELKNKHGTYVLVIRLNKTMNIRFSKNKSSVFKKGIYIYVGSARAPPVSLYHRLKRHLSKNKNKHWHIDRLLEHAKIDKIYYTMENVECNVALELYMNDLGYIDGFGCSDCRCRSHLFYIND